MAQDVQVIIRFKEAVTKASTDLLTAQGADITNVLGSINAVSAKIPADKIELLRADPGVEYVEIDQEAHILGFPDEMAEGLRKALAAGQAIPWGVTKIRAPEVWAGNRGAGIKGCIIDTGIDYNHPELKENYKGGYNVITKTNDPLDDNGHGSHVAGIAAAKDNDVGVVGVAPEMDIYAVKVLDANGSGSYSNITAAIQWAIDNGMQIINMSLGGSSYSKALEDICNAAYEKGILIVAAAGNSGGDGSQDKVTYPAKLDSVMAVAATDLNDQRASFSSAGPDVEVAAPGVSIPSTVPTSNAKYSDPSGYKSLSGTSMACPHAFGTAALVMSKYPNLKNTEVRDILNRAVVDLGTQGRDVFYGNGRIDAKAAVDNDPSPKRYRCTGAPDYQCIEDPEGQFASLEECQAKCNSNPPPKRYRCTGAPDYQCIEDPEGQFASLEECQAKCSAPPKRYRCTGAPDYQCIEDPEGQFASLEECQAKCSAPPAEKKFRVHVVGSARRPAGVLIAKSTRGDYDAAGACKAVCDMLKKM